MTPRDVVLGIDTSAGVGAAAAAPDARGVSTTKSQALEGLLPCVRGALASIDRELSAVRAIAVCAGPGSFTGLRIGVAFAKSLAQALHVAVCGVSSFDVLAAVRAANERISPRLIVIQGKRGFFYAHFVAPIDGQPPTISGDRDVVSEAARSAFGAQAGEAELGRAFAALDCDPGVRSSAVADRGRALLDAGASGDWRRLAIEYGQRPNAVTNWELRHGRA